MGVVVVLGALFAAACGDKGGTTGGDTANAGSSAKGDESGIPECAANLKKYDEVIDAMKKCKVPDVAKAGWDTGVKAMEDSRKALQDAQKSYKDLDAAGKKAAADACKASAQAIKAMPCPAG
jgi:hypothetical protein